MDGVSGGMREVIEGVSVRDFLVIDGSTADVYAGLYLRRGKEGEKVDCGWIDRFYGCWIEV